MTPTMTDDPTDALTDVLTKGDPDDSSGDELGEEVVGTSAGEFEELARRVDRAEAMEFASLMDEVARSVEDGFDPAFFGLDDRALVDDFRVAGAEITAAMCRWLLMLGEIVRRKIWALDGAKTPSDWLSHFVSMAPSTAREHVRVALRLRHFPKTTERFAAGQLSYSKVRAITRTGRPDLEDLLLRYATYATGAQLESILASFRGVRRRQAAREIDLHELRDLRYVEREDGTAEIRIRLPELQALELYNRIDHHADRMWDELREGRTAEDLEVVPLPSHRQLRADALLDLIDRAGEARPDTSGIDRHTLVIHTDASLLAGPDHDQDRLALDGASAEARADGETASAEAREEGQDIASAETRGDGGEDASAEAPERMAPVRYAGRERLGAMSVRALRRLACDARLAVVAHDQDGNVVSASGTTRTIPARLKRMLYARDRHCRFPSCQATRGLEGHHIVFWSDDGPTILSNLVLLCRYHHHFVHDERWTIHHDGHGRFRFRPPDGEIVPTVRPMAQLDPLRRFSVEGWQDMEFEPDALTSQWDGLPVDKPYAVAVLFDRLERLQPPAGIDDTAVAA